MLKEKYLKIKEQGFTQECLLVSLCFTLLVWVLFVATPFDIVASNSEEFTFVPGISILCNGLFYGLFALIGLFFLYVLASLTLKKNIRKFLLFALIAFSLSIWLNSTFLIGVYGQFDGINNLQISPFGLLSWIQISAFLIIFALAIYFRRKTKIFIAIISSAFMISFFVSTINIASKLSGKEIKHSSKEQFFTYSKNNPNLLFILLDEYQSDYFAEILDDELKSDFNGFIWFRDAACNFPTTVTSFPAMLTGEIYEKNLEVLGFYKTNSGHSIANQFPAGQVNYTAGPAHIEYLFPDGSFIDFFKSEIHQLNTYRNLIKYSVFRAVPDILKQRIYHHGNWSFKLTKLTNYFIHSKYLGWPNDMLESLKYFANKKLISADGPSTFKFYYSGITHSPTFFSAKCQFIGNVPNTLQNKSAEGSCVISQLVEVINNLKKENIFHNTMVIISSDHGSVFSENIPLGRAFSTLLIKPLYTSDLFQISDYPAQLSDIPKTIATAFNIPHEYPGIDLLSKRKPKNRLREFNDYIWSYSDWNSLKSRGSTITKYKIDGPLRDPKSWTLTKNISPDPPTQLTK